MDTSSFVDGLGRRVRITEPDGEALEALRLCRTLSDAASTEGALIERAGRLAAFSHPSFGIVRRIERLHDVFGGLAIVSEAVPGVRLSELFRRAQRGWVDPDPGATLSLLQHIAGALADLHHHAPDAAHGALGPERIVVKPDGRPAIVDYILGPAIEQLRMGRGQLWLEFRVPVPPVAGTVRFDQFTDVLQLGVLALALGLGRPLGRDDFPQALPALLAELSGREPNRTRPTLPRAVQAWIARAVSLEPRSSFRNAVEAAVALEIAVGADRDVAPSLGAVVRHVDACPADADGARSDTTGRVAQHLPGLEREAARGAGEWPGPGRAGLARGRAPAVVDGEPAGSRVLMRIARRPRTAAAGARAGRPSPPPTSRWQIDWRESAHRAAERARTSLAGWIGAARTIWWTAAWRGVRVLAIAAGLTALFGATYLGARGYFGLDAAVPRTGVLVLESLPAGAEVLVDGRSCGVTPATLELGEGEHTIGLRLQKRLTLLPVVVEAGDRTVRRVDLRRRPPATRPASPPLSRDRHPQ